MRFTESLEGGRLVYLLPLFASAFAGAAGLVNFRTGDEFAVYLVISVSMLVVAAAQYLER